VSVLAALIAVTTLLPAQADGAKPVNLRFWAVEASVEQRDEPYFERAVLDARPALVGLPFDTFRAVNTGWKSVGCKDNAEFSIDQRYSLSVTPERAENTDRLRLHIVVTLHPRDADASPVRALDTRLHTMSAKPIAVRGLKLENGNDLVIVLDATL